MVITALDAVTFEVVVTKAAVSWVSVPLTLMAFVTVADPTTLPISLSSLEVIDTPASSLNVTTASDAVTFEAVVTKAVVN